MGLVGHFQKFIPTFVQKTFELTRLFKKDVKWTWTDKHTEIVISLKNAINSSPILSIYDPKLETIVYTDASRDGLVVY